jgi:hypothetical protein
MSLLSLEIAHGVTVRRSGSPRESSEGRFKKNKTRATFPKGTRARVAGGGVRGLLFPLPQVCDGATI